MLKRDRKARSSRDRMPGRLTGSKHLRQTGQVSSTSAPHFGQRMGIFQVINPDEPGSKGKGNEKRLNSAPQM
jgi:hypothetical protein